MLKFKRSTQIATAIVLFVSTALSVTPAQAAGILVNTTGDTIDANSSTCAGMVIGDLPGPDGVISLREAICAANGTAGADTITFSVSGTITLGSTLPDITSNVTIDGSGQSVTVSGGGNYRVLYVAGGGDLSLNNLTIANGDATSGGGIFNGGTITAITNSTISGNTGNFGAGIYTTGTITTIANSTFSGNVASQEGGGIYEWRTLIDTIANCTFSGNSSTWDGGGIYMEGGTITTIANSTFSGNSGWRGGGIFTEDGYITTIANSTFSDNSADEDGGGIFNRSRITTIANSTFSGNSALVDGGGIHNYIGDITTIANSIVADSPSGGNCYAGAPGTSTNNLTDSAGCWAWTDTLLPTHLGPLAGNGGSTQTHALLVTTPANPAINNGDISTCSSAAVNNLDQRGVSRPPGWQCDIGAFEVEFPLVFVTNVALLNGSPVAEGANVSGDVSVLVITFSQDVFDIAAGNDKYDVTSTANYLLVKNGATGIPINFVSYSNNGGSGPFQAHVLVNNSAFLTAGTYTLTVDGTTSIRSTYGARLAGDGASPGSDFVRNFGITGSGGGGGGADGGDLPDTGFALGVVTELPIQPVEKAYADLGDLWLEIPNLDVAVPIVGVPKVDGDWDVDWLGAQAGWLEGSAYPTLAGNTVLTAHVWDAYDRPGPFINLKNLVHGDQVLIHSSGMVYTYEVRYNYLVRPDNPYVMRHEEYDWVTLLTCESYNPGLETYRFRRVVRAALVDVSIE